MAESPTQLTRISRITLIGSLLFAGALFLLSLFGVSDPRPLGGMIYEDAEGETVRAAGETVYTPAPVTLTPPGSMTAEMSLALSTDLSAYGVYWRDSAGTYAALVTPTGYLGILHVEGDEEGFIRPFERFIHVKPGDNAFQVDFTGTEAVIRLNEEWVVAIPYTPAGPIETGVILRAPDEAAEIVIEQLALWGG